jgi:cytochrome c oxidase subunit 4
VSDTSTFTEHDHDETSHHIVSPLEYTFVYLALIVGTIVTVLVADIDLHVWNPILALAIACAKGTIVILFFMHVKYQSKLVKMTVAAGFFTFIVLITMTLTDYISRAWGLW